MTVEHIRRVLVITGRLFCYFFSPVACPINRLLDFPTTYKISFAVHAKHSSFQPSADVKPMSNDLVRAMPCSCMFLLYPPWIYFRIDVTFEMRTSEYIEICISIDMLEVVARVFI